MIEIKNLRKTYGKKVALKSFSYTFEDGIYGMLGANGAGKSTLMNLLTDNVKRDSGEILYDGKEILKMGGSYLEKVGYMPQQQGFYESFSARMFLVYMAELKGLRKKEAKKQESREQQEVKSEVEIHNAENKTSEITVPSSQRVSSSTGPTTDLNKSVNRNKDFVAVSQSSKKTSDTLRQSNSTQNQEKPILWVLLDSKAFWICLIILLISLSIVMSGFRKRCRNCGKWWAMKIIRKRLVDEKASWIKKEFKDKTRDGRIIRTREEAVPATVYTYRIDRQCKHCGHEDYLIKEEKREN